MKFGLCLLIVGVLIVTGCATGIPPLASSTPEPALAPTLAPTPWSPNQDKLLVVPREYLTREEGFVIIVPPADLVIIPVSVGEYEYLAGWGWSAKGKTEDYIDSWLVNSSGDKITQSGRAFNFGTSFVYGLGPGTYYIYLSNEFTSTSAKEVTLWVRWSP